MKRIEVPQHKKAKSVYKSVRTSEYVWTTLEKLAKEEGLKVNGYVSLILTDYVNGLQKAGEVPPERTKK